ncbi:YjbQ family protein [Candidatus Woesearchaeota archaeon]|nr:YjbQ family protein [Candidatus Woesearchaeota archaeon]
MTFTVRSTKKQEVLDITQQVAEVVAASAVPEGIVVVSALHTTAVIIINENFDPNLNDDFLAALSLLIPAGKWKHDVVDGNGAAHLKSAVVGSSQTVIISQGKLLLGRWQNLMLVDFDGPRERTVAVQVVKS